MIPGSVNESSDWNFMVGSRSDFSLMIIKFKELGVKWNDGYDLSNGLSTLMNIEIRVGYIEKGSRKVKVTLARAEGTRTRNGLQLPDPDVREKRDLSPIESMMVVISSFHSTVVQCFVNSACAIHMYGPMSSKGIKIEQEHKGMALSMKLAQYNRQMCTYHRQIRMMNEHVTNRISIAGWKDKKPCLKEEDFKDIASRLRPIMLGLRQEEIDEGNGSIAIGYLAEILIQQHVDDIDVDDYLVDEELLFYIAELSLMECCCGIDDTKIQRLKYANNGYKRVCYGNEVFYPGVNDFFPGINKTNLCKKRTMGDEICTYVRFDADITVYSEYTISKMIKPIKNITWTDTVTGISVLEC